MSSVGSSDSADRAADKNQLRRTRDEMRQRESDLIKRHNVETRRRAEKNQDEIQNLKAKHSEQMDSARESSHDAISRRDHRYQQEIEDIRGLHRKQLQNNADEVSRREGAFRKAIDNDKRVNSKHNDERFDKLEQEFRTRAEKESDLYAGHTAQNKETQDGAIRTMREKLTAQHELETDALRNSLQEKLEKTQGDFSDYRREVAEQRRDAQTRGVQSNKDASEKLMGAVRNERLDRVQNEQNLREDYRDSLEGQRERYDKALKKNLDGAREANRNFQSASEDRGTNKINSLRRENREIREQGARENRQIKHQADRELHAAKEAFQDNVDAYRRERDDAYSQTNVHDRAEVKSMREGLEKQLRDTSTDLQTKMDDQSRTYRREYGNIKNEYEGRLTAKDQLSDQRYDHIVSVATEEKDRLTRLNEDNHAAAQRSKQDEMKALRSTLEGDKRDTVDTMREMMRKQELRHADRLGQVVAKYDKQVQALKDELQRERRLGTENTKRTTDDMQRAHQLDLDQAEAKSRAKLNEINARHENEVRAVSKRYEEKLDQVLSEMKKS